jgi:transposase InsO family protein
MTSSSDETSHTASYWATIIDAHSSDTARYGPPPSSTVRHDASSYTEELAKNLVSMALIARNGHQLRINQQGCTITTASGRTVLRAQTRGNMLQLPICLIPPPPSPPTAASDALALSVSTASIDVNQLHRRLGHAREKRLRAVLKEQGLKWPAGGLAKCAVCQQGKATRKPSCNKTLVPRASRPMERVHSDVCGPMSVATCNYHGKQYFVSFIDDHSRFATVYLLQEKSEVKDALRHYLKSAPAGHRCRFLHTDQGSEYKNGDVARLLFKHGATHETTSSHTPEHNSVAERFNRTILDMVRCMLLDSDLPKNMWGEALNTAVAINNRLPTAANDDKVPISRWDMTLNRTTTHLHRFSEPVQVLIPTKLGARTRNRTYLGPARANATHHRIHVN